MDGGYARLMSEEEGGIARVVHVFDHAEWRFELGSWAAALSGVKFDPKVCEVDLEEIGFAPGWSASKNPPPK